MKTLNRRDFPGAQYPERIIQFGEGNFLRAFVDWQIDLLNEHTDLNSGVVVVRPIETSFPPSLSTQDGLYTTIIRGLNEKGEAVSDARLIRSVNREISVYSEYDEFLKLAHNPGKMPVACPQILCRIGKPYIHPLTLHTAVPFFFQQV